jgi:succinyl-CoA synthetase alpha subunit
MGHSKHRKSGHSGHNSDMIQTAREINKAVQENKKLKEGRKEPMFDSVTKAFESTRKKK